MNRALEPVFPHSDVTGADWLCTLKIVSLRELMFEYAIDILVQGMSGLFAARDVLRYNKSPLSPADPKKLKSLSKILAGLRIMGKNIGLDSSLLEQIDTLYQLISSEDCKTPTNRIETRLDLIIQGILGNLDSKKFMFVPTDQALSSLV
jgi:hypothetical protein